MRPSFDTDVRERGTGYNTDDIEAIRAEKVQVNPLPFSEQSGGKTLPRQTRPAGAGLLAQPLVDRQRSVVPVEQKVFLDLKEAAEYSGMPKTWRIRGIKAINAGGWRRRRSELEQL